MRVGLFVFSSHGCNRHRRCDCSRLSCSRHHRRRRKIFLKSTAATTLWFGLGFINDDLSTENFGVVQAGQRVLCFAVFRHLNKTKAFAAAANFVLNDFCGSH